MQDVSLHVRRGEAVGLLGPNGAGKTTVFYMITGLVQAGQGRHRTRRPPRHQVADVSARAPWHRLPAAGSLDFPRPQRRGQYSRRARSQRARPSARARRTLDSLLEEFDIARLRKAPSIALSGGERRRCEIARALAGKPSFMLLDEPFAGIDPIAVGDIQDLVRHLKSRGIGVLITDHNVRETLGLIDRAYIIHSGQVLTEGPPDAIVAHPDVRGFISAKISGCSVASRLLVLAEPVGHSAARASSASSASAPSAATRDRRAEPRAQRQDPHDRIAADGLAAARDFDLGFELFDALHEFGGGPRVQALAVDDAHLAHQRAFEDRGRRAGLSLRRRSSFAGQAPCWRR